MPGGGEADMELIVPRTGISPMGSSIGLSKASDASLPTVIGSIIG